VVVWVCSGQFCWECFWLNSAPGCVMSFQLLSTWLRKADSTHSIFNGRLWSILIDIVHRFLYGTSLAGAVFKNWADLGRSNVAWSFSSILSSFIIVPGSVVFQNFGNWCES
jgi:hypothetical protein